MPVAVDLAIIVCYPQRSGTAMNLDLMLVIDTQVLNTPFCGVRRLCCTNPVRDSSCESIVVAGRHEQTHIPNLQDQELVGLQ